ncbi:MAG: SDR family oxidoreductase [Oscillospiraceae bacterium]|nr:SDR family oxidoreductase [Oscillospiraceae bacterium]MCM0705474.1 SDR family oxidoreductase [Faecalicatena sp. BF-R-105]MDY3220046.1 SDR family oxidoreductase [Candidatus Fimivivens sp.]SFI79740.1 2-deoxy-D-gluconate 3-dehydrogenase [Ruminococcaceae bacterium D5]GKH49094.1 2-deoxy-D-gluconate 3-dehydrogenase [Eubacteriales bacterium]
MDQITYQMFDLTGKKAIVTGAGQGMGRSMAQALIGAGATVALIGRGQNVVETCREIDPTGKAALPFLADLSQREQIHRVFDEVMDAFGGELDILVNNAGIQRRHMPEDFPIEEWDEVLAVNLNAVWIMAQLAGRVMLAKGSGKIINIASLNSFLGGTTVPAYTAAKSGVAGLTRALSDDWAGRGVNVNAIAPGYIATSLNTALIGNPDREPKILARLPKKRWGEPDDMKGAVIFLASAASDYVTGVTLAVDGGYLCT